MNFARTDGKATGRIRTDDLRFTKQPDAIVTHDAGDSCNPCAEGAGKSAGNLLDRSALPPAIPIDDAELASVVAAWPALPTAIRRAVLALVGSVTGDAETETPTGGHEIGGFGDGAAGDAGDAEGGGA